MPCLACHSAAVASVLLLVVLLLDSSMSALSSVKRVISSSSLGSSQVDCCCSSVIVSALTGIVSFNVSFKPGWLAEIVSLLIVFAGCTVLLEVAVMLSVVVFPAACRSRKEGYGVVPVVTAV